ncbi:MAG: hypothetical protein ACLP1X_11825 [Polyangiaceae bacterium]|jgi:hypothetical protein
MRRFRFTFGICVAAAVLATAGAIATGCQPNPSGHCWQKGVVDGGAVATRVYNLTSNTTISPAVVLAGAFVIKAGVDGGTGGAPATIAGVSIASPAGPIPIATETDPAVQSNLSSNMGVSSGDQVAYFKTAVPVSADMGEVFTITASVSNEFAGTMLSGGDMETSLQAGAPPREVFTDSPQVCTTPTPTSAPAFPRWSLLAILASLLLAIAAFGRRAAGHRAT